MRSIERISITDEVVKRLTEEIISGRYEVGDKLATERELSDELKVGRSTVREALRVLQAMEYIEIRQGRGAYVRKTAMDSDDKIREWFARHEFQLRDFIEIRMSLEPLAVSLAVERATEAEIEKVGSILDLFEQASRSGDVLDLASTDEAFHSSIMEATHNNLLIILNQKLAEAFKEYRLRSFAVKENAKNALEPHQRIFAAIRDRDRERGIKEMKRHLEITLDDIHTTVERAEGRQ